MDAALYFDDFEEGIIPATSHPVFVRYAIADFFYSQGDDFSPFGNDTGNDTLRFLEEWYQERRAGEKATTFLRRMIEEWGFGTDYLLIKDPSQFENIDLQNRHLTDTLDQATIAVAFGQYKIAGRADKAIICLAVEALQRQRYLAEKARIRETNPWDLAAEYIDRLDEMKSVLTAMTNKKAR